MSDIETSSLVFESALIEMEKTNNFHGNFLIRIVCEGIHHRRQFPSLAVSGLFVITAAAAF